MELFDKVTEACAFLNARGFHDVEIGIVLGSGLGKLAEQIENAIIIDYTDIPHFSASTVESHKGKLIFGRLGNKNAVAMQGRLHYYEGYDMQAITFPIRVMKFLGASTLLLSGAAGAMNLNFKKGDLMMITDQINLLPSNPLIGKNDDRLGPRFPDMSETYAKGLQEAISSAAALLNITLRKGVYASVQGPMLESPEEYRFLRTIGADAVGMSTVPEVIVAKHSGMSCAAVIVLTDECDPDNLKPINIADILETAARAEEKLILLIPEVIRSI
jgi:purine-nucleoside phosphorylase